MKKLNLVLGLFGLVSLLYGQSTSVTNNNTIIIQGNVYYFQPSNTPSSPLPTAGSSNFIGNGSWYGENAARAWASISDWAVERCIGSSDVIRGSNNERVYISQVHAYSVRTSGWSRFINIYWNSTQDIGAIAIYYWIVKNGEMMENGRRAVRYFYF